MKATVLFLVLDSNSGIVIQYTYDGKGRRISKGNISYTYDCEGNLIKQSNGLEFFYDSEGVAGFVYNSEPYYYKKDAQGNIIEILNKTGGVEAKYAYDAWGNHRMRDVFIIITKEIKI